MNKALREVIKVAKREAGDMLDAVTISRRKNHYHIKLKNGATVYFLQTVMKQAKPVPA